MVTLSANMKVAIRRLSWEGEKCARDLGVGFSTLEALERRRLVRRRDEQSAQHYPMTNIYWRLTGHGRKALQEIGE